MTEQQKKKEEEKEKRPFKIQTVKRTLLPSLLNIACQGQIQILKFFSAKTVKDLGHLMEKAMATHSSTLAWKIPRTEEPDKLQSMGSQRVGHH